MPGCGAPDGGTGGVATTPPALLRGGSRGPGDSVQCRDGTIAVLAVACSLTKASVATCSLRAAGGQAERGRAPASAPSDRRPRLLTDLPPAGQASSARWWSTERSGRSPATASWAPRSASESRRAFLSKSSKPSAASLPQVVWRLATQLASPAPAVKQTLPCDFPLRGAVASVFGV